MVALDQAAHEEILWWKDHLHTWNGRALFQDPVDLVIETDASLKGWGAYCQGVRTGGPWSFEEKRLHINCLELLAGSLAVKTFTKSKVCAHVYEGLLGSYLYIKLCSCRTEFCVFKSAEYHSNFHEYNLKLTNTILNWPNKINVRPNII